MHVAIVGAGAAGAAATYGLHESGLDADVTVLERSRQIGGRAATRRARGCRYDVGANYVKSESDRVDELLTSELSTAGLVDVRAPVWTFDADGEVREGDDRDDHKWTYEDGIDGLPRRLLDAADAHVRLENHVSGLEPGADADDEEPDSRQVADADGGETGRHQVADADDGETGRHQVADADSERRDGWRVVDADGTSFGRFDAVVLTPPAPDTAAILAGSDGGSLERLRAAADAVPYRPIYSVALHYRFAVERAWYALVNVDRKHEVGWLAREELKRGHVPDGESLLIVQMASGWSDDRADDPGETVAGDAASRVAELLDDDRLSDPNWTDGTFWRAALPAGQPDEELQRAEPRGIAVAGDWVAGDGRVHLAVESGLEAADRVVADLRSR